MVGRILVVAKIALASAALVVLLAVAARATVYGHDRPAEGVLGAATGLAMSLLVVASRICRAPSLRATTVLRCFVLGATSTAAFFAIDSVLFH